MISDLGDDEIIALPGLDNGHTEATPRSPRVAGSAAIITGRGLLHNPTLLLMQCLLCAQIMLSASAFGKQNSANQSNHIALVVPAFNVTSFDTTTPLTSRDKLSMALKSSIDSTAFLGAGLKAGVYQATNTPADFGQGASGFAKRFGAAYADGTTGKLLGIYVFPSLLRQDPRYFRKGTGRTSNRLGYALTRVFVTRSDQGRNAVNWSKAASSFGSGAISTLYYPHEEESSRVIIGNAAWSFGSEALTNVLKEFWPDIQRKLGKH